MKTIITLSILVFSLNSMASSETQLKNCLQKALTASSLELNRSDKATNVLKSMNGQIKSCKDEIKSIVKAEKQAKKKAKLLDQIKKLQAKLNA